MTSEMIDDTAKIVTLAPSANVHASMLMTVTLSPKPQPMMREKDKAGAVAASQDFVPTSVEKRAVPRELSVANSGTGFGYCCILAEASRVGKPVEFGQYLMVAMGRIQLRDDVSVAVGMTSDDEQEADFKAMMKSVETAAVTPAR